jgi:hypothetical protein
MQKAQFLTYSPVATARKGSITVALCEAYFFGQAQSFATPAAEAGVCCMMAARGAAMEKNLCIASMSVAGLLLLLFVLDLVLGYPFSGGVAFNSVFLMIDIIGIVAGALLLYLSWNALRDLL